MDVEADDVVGKKKGGDKVLVELDEDEIDWFAYYLAVSFIIRGLSSASPTYGASSHQTSCLPARKSPTTSQSPTQSLSHPPSLPPQNSQ